MWVWLTQFQVTWGNLQPSHLQLVPPCMLKPSGFASSPLLNEVLVIIAEALVRNQQVTNPIQGMSIMISHDRDPLSFFHIYWRHQVILWEWLQHSYWIISIGMYILLSYNLICIFSCLHNMLDVAHPKWLHFNGRRSPSNKSFCYNLQVDICIPLFSLWL